MPLLDTALILTAYLFGSIATAVVVCRLAGLPDPRSEGSGNPGATNVLRIGGRKVAALTLAGDLIKGLLPILIARLLSDDPTLLALVGAAAFLGHLYPIFFGFRGGKGVATALGVMLGMIWPVALAALIAWLLMAKLFRISSLAALTAATLTPLFAWLLTPEPAYLIFTSTVALLLIWRHRSNIRNLLKGREGRMGGY